MRDCLSRRLWLCQKYGLRGSGSSRWLCCSVPHRARPSQGSSQSPAKELMIKTKFNNDIDKGHKGKEKEEEEKEYEGMRRRWSSWPEEDEPWWRLEGEVLLEPDSQGPSFVGTTPGCGDVDCDGDNVESDGDGYVQHGGKDGGINLHHNTHHESDGDVYWSSGWGRWGEWTCMCGATTMVVVKMWRWSDGDGLWDGHDHHGGKDEKSELVGVGLLGKRSNWYFHHPPSYSWIQWTWPRESSKN